MSPEPFVFLRVRSLRRGTCQALSASGLACLLLASSPFLSAAAAIPDAPTVGPAPIVDQPLPPISGDETPENPPSSQHVWIPGHWRWQDGNYVWVSAHWELPPVDGDVWVPPHWETQDNGYVLAEGYWEEGIDDDSSSTGSEDQSMVAPSPPPPRRSERISERPSSAEVWISGYWVWRSGRYVWTPGRWERPPRDHVVWVPPRWQQRGGSYVFIQGYWRDVSISVGIGNGRPLPKAGPPGRPIVLARPPPPPRDEVRGPRPSPQHVWVGGYWTVRVGHTVWISGHWQLPPRGNKAWAAPRWERRRDGYHFVEGSWH